ncbi:MAG: hypothetical protein IJ776_09805 [Paludibacteraceae bacterium]|nr:hypothetical protein [Paludibacteraceae bacterium]
MKTLKYMFATALVALFAVSCKNYSYIARESNIPDKTINATPTIVDIKADYKFRIQEQSGRCRTKEEAMAEAKYKAILNNKIDIVVDPIYKIERRPTGYRKYTAWLTGFAGYYVNDRTVLEDIKQLKDLPMEDIEKYLLMRDPELIRYFREGTPEGDVINIYHNDTHHNMKAQQAPKEEPVSQTVVEPQQQPQQKPVQTSKKKKK